MNGWMTSFNRKKHQRRVNRYVCAINKNISKDDLWRGRFIVRQTDSPWFYTYEDKSGAELEHIHLVITDLMTGRTYEKWDSANGWCHFNGHHLWEFVNYAIVEYFDVWHSDSDPRDLRDDPNYNFNNPKVRKYWEEKWNNE